LAGGDQFYRKKFNSMLVRPAQTETIFVRALCFERPLGCVDCI
jgi:hypothetical protein